MNKLSGKKWDQRNKNESVYDGKYIISNGWTEAIVIKHVHACQEVRTNVCLEIIRGGGIGCQMNWCAWRRPNPELVFWIDHFSILQRC